MPGTRKSTRTWPRGTSPRSAGARTSASSRITYGSSSTGSESAGSGTFRSTPRAERPGTRPLPHASRRGRRGKRPPGSPSPRRPDEAPRSARALVDLHLDAVRADRPRLREVELETVDPVREETLAAAEDRREDHQPQLVDEVVLEERVDERATAGNEDRALSLFFELLQPADDVAGDDTRVLPLRIRQGVRDDDLRVAVQLVRERPFAGRPRFGETLVGDAPEELHIRVHELVELELVAFVSPVVLEGPGPVLAVLRAARILEDSVDGNELRDNQLSHLCSPFVADWS